MPLGTDFDGTGWLNERAGRFSFRPDTGGTWRLDCSPRLRSTAKLLAGQRVRLTGERDGFDLLAVRSIDALGEAGAS